MVSNFVKATKKYGFSFALWKSLEKLGIVKGGYSDLCIQKYYMRMPLELREKALCEWYYSETGKNLNLESPSTFNEKIQWLKLYDSTPIKTNLADKYLVRDWVKDKIGDKYLIPLLGVWNSFSEIDFSSLPKSYVLKATHGSSMNIIVREDKPLNMNSARKEINFWMKDYYGIGPMQEWHYLNVPHKIVAEQYMENIDGDLYDYKFYCFDGEPEYIQVIKGRNTDSQMAFYDINWNTAPFSYLHFGEMKQKVEKPKQLQKALELAKTLSKGFSFVRVDFYLLADDDIYFGEMTFTPASGVRHWIPEGTDEMLGNLLVLPKEKYLPK